MNTIKRLPSKTNKGITPNLGDESLRIAAIFILLKKGINLCIGQALSLIKEGTDCRDKAGYNLTALTVIILIGLIETLSQSILF